MPTRSAAVVEELRSSGGSSPSRYFRTGQDRRASARVALLAGSAIPGVYRDRPRHAHEREWRKDPDHPLGGYLASIRDWWEEVPDVHGDVRIYTSEGRPKQPGYRWVELRVRFTNGRVQEVEEKEPAPAVSEQGTTSASPS